MPEEAIVDTSALIALEKINLQGVLCRLYSQITVPQAVILEYGRPGIPCLSIVQVKRRLLNLLIHDLNLGRGESEVIALAAETDTRAIIDDLRARKVAKDLGIKVVGTIGILLKAESDGLIPSAYEKVKELRAKGFHVSDKLLEEIATIRGYTTPV